MTDIPALLAEWERAAQSAYGSDALVRTIRLIEAGDKLAKELAGRTGARGSGEQVTIVHAVETCSACPAQWDAWDSTGRYWYLHYRSGTGTMSRVNGGDPDDKLSFDTGDPLDGSITLEEFCQRIGVVLDLQ